MKNTFFKSIGICILAILTIAVFAQSETAAQDNFETKSDAQTESTLFRGYPRNLEGTWVSDVTFRNCQTGDAIRTFAAMNTYMSGGTMVETGLGVVPLTRTVGHGVWDHDTGRRFISKFRFFRFNADGTYGGFNIIRRQIELNQHGSTYSATWVAQGFTPDGTLLGTACATETATRFDNEGERGID